MQPILFNGFTHFRKRAVTEWGFQIHSITLLRMQILASMGNYYDLKFVLPFRQSDWDGFQFRRINSAVMKIRLFKPVLF